MENQAEGSVSVCQCQIAGSLPVMWHRENDESSCGGSNPNQKERQETGWLFSRERPSLRMRN